MAPRKRKGATEAEGTNTTTFKRVTRSQTHGDTKEKVEQVKPEKKKKNTVKGKAKGKEENTKPETDAEQEDEASGKDEVEQAAENGGEAEADDVSFGGPPKGKTVVVEHCTQCTQFKKRAIMVKDGLTNAVPGVTVLLNPVKPRRGCFEIREEDGETFVSLLGMKRPFEPMKKLVMEDVIASIIDKIRG